MATKKAATPAKKSVFAVIETGGKQYRVTEGDTVKIEKLAGEAGDKVTFDKVLLTDDGMTTTLGTPYISSAKVVGVIKTQGRADKVRVSKFKAKTGYSKTYGHRQPFTEVTIESCTL